NNRLGDTESSSATSPFNSIPIARSPPGALTTIGMVSWNSPSGALLKTVNVIEAIGEYCIPDWGSFRSWASLGGEGGLTCTSIHLQVKSPGTTISEPPILVSPRMSIVLDAGLPVGIDE